MISTMSRLLDKKAADSVPKSVYESYSGFANTNGGYRKDRRAGVEGVTMAEIRWNDRVTYDGTWENNLFTFLQK